MCDYEMYDKRVSVERFPQISVERTNPDYECIYSTQMQMIS